MNAITTRIPARPARFLVSVALGLRRRLLSAANAFVPPQLPLFELTTGMGRTEMLASAARLRLADLLAEEPLDGKSLAARTSTDPDAMQRMMRALVAMGVFAMKRDGRFRNNRVSEGLRSDRRGTFRDIVDYWGSASNVTAWMDFRRTLETGKNAFERVHGMSIWHWFDQHPEERSVFAAAMAAMTELEAPSIARAYPFDEVRRVCDVAGSRGVLLAELLATHRHLEGVLFDNAGVIAEAEPFLAERGLLDRVTRTSGSFFESVPSGCDAYVLKNILHDWDDDRSVAILENCRRAMLPGARLLVVELVLERDGVPEVAALVDMQMMLVCSDGRERSRAEFARLFKLAGFELRRVLPTSGLMSIVEGVAR